MGIRLISTDVRSKSQQYEVSLKHPERFSDFVDVLGIGAFGEVVLAKDKENNNKEVAIKKLDVDNINQVRHVKEILREVVILHWAKHPQIVELITVYMEHYERVPTTVYIVMGYCGINLVDYTGTKTLSLDEAADIIYNIARGLNFLHAFGIYHRDLKPDNICIDGNDLKYRAKIIDLGYARKKPRDSNELTRKIATMCYRAPENLIGMKYSAKIDVWSLGCIFGFVINAKHIFLDDKRDGTARAFLKTLELICGYLGKPPQTFMEKIETYVKQHGDKVDNFTWKPFKELIKNVGGRKKDIFSHIPADPKKKKDDGINLMEGMLKWDHTDRISIKDILESEFVANIPNLRDMDSETLPTGKLREDIKCSLDTHENEITDILSDRDNALDDMKNYLCDVIAKEFGCNDT